MAEALQEATAAESGDNDTSGLPPPEVDSPRDREENSSSRSNQSNDRSGSNEDPDGLALMEEVLRDDEERPQTLQRAFPAEDIDEDAVKIVRRLQHHGHAAFLVGGCVRDLMAGQHPKDFDVATSATPRQIKRLFRNCRIIGRRFKLVHIFFRDGKIIELATFRAPPRQDENDELLITDDNVFGTPREDAFRRDFTINALLYDPSTDQVVDFVGGLEDIDQRRIRSIGSPDIRFQEDPVRILRALKFAARLDYAIDPEDEAAIGRHRLDLLKSPMARLLEEIQKILGCGSSAFSFRGLKESGVLKAILPPVDSRVSMPDEGSALFWRLLESLDVTSGGKRIFSNTVMLACMIFPLYLEEAERDGGGNFGHLSRWLGEFFRSCELLQQVPRRDKSRIRQILSSLWRFQRPADAPPYSVAAFRSREYFPDALQFWKLVVAATGRGAEHVDFWDQQVEETTQEAAPASRDPEERPRTREERPQEAPLPDPEPNYRQPSKGAHRPRATGFGATKESAYPRNSTSRGFGAESRKLTQPLGFGEGITGNTQIRHQQLGFGEEVEVNPTRTLSAAGGVGFGEDALYVGRAQKKKTKKKLPVIPGVNTPDILGERRGKKSRKRRKGKSGGGGSGGGGGSRSGRSGGDSSGRSKGNRKRRRRRR